VDATPVMLIVVLRDQPVALKERNGLRNGATSDAEVFGNGDGKVTEPVRLRKVGEHLQLHRKQAVARCVVSNGLMQKRPKVIKSQRVRIHE
jgi:hypothetical protein